MLPSIIFSLILAAYFYPLISASGSSGYYKVTTETPLKSQNILSLSKEEKRKFLDSFDNVFSDIDGVVWNLEHDIEGAPAGFKELQNAGKKLNFITNNSVRPVQSYAEKFHNLKMNVDVNDIIHPAKSIVEYLKSINFDGLIYIIATETFKNVLRDAGFKLIDGPTKIIQESYTEMASHVFDREPVRAVVVDVDFNLSSLKLIRAHVYLRNPTCLLIAGATDMLLPVRKDISIIGPGPFAKVLAESSTRKMIKLGKPGKELAAMLTKLHNIKDSKRVLMIGDMLEQDVGFGRECGFQTLAVLSGGCSYEELRAQTNPDLIPDYYADSIGDFVQFMYDLNKTNA